MKIGKVFPDACIPVCFSANNDFIGYTAVMIRSVLDHASPDHNYDIIILYTDITEERREKVLSLAAGMPNVSIRFTDISAYISSLTFFTESVYTGTKYTNEAYYRLLIPSLMSDYEKVIYLDGDMIALTDLAALYETDMNGYMLASSRDFGGICNCYIEGDPRRAYREGELGIRNIDNYIISGMLIFNCAEFNARYTGEELMKFCASRPWRQHDQDVLNVLCQDALRIIDASWDYVENMGSFRTLPPELFAEYEESAKNVKIVHFAGPRKPWKTANATYAPVFWLTAWRTPFFHEIFSALHGEYAYKKFILSDILGMTPELLYGERDLHVGCGEYYIGATGNFYSQIYTLVCREGELTVEGYVTLLPLGKQTSVGVFLDVGGELFPAEITQRDASEYRFGALWYRAVSFCAKATLPLQYEGAIRLVFTTDGENFIECKNLRFHPLCPVNRTPRQYYATDGRIFTATARNIFVRPAGRRAVFAAERAYQKKLPWKMRLRRTAYFLHRLFSKKELWIVSDRFDAAGDNGEAFFSYLQKHRPKNTRVYFAIEKSSPDYPRLKKIGKVLDKNSRKYRFYRIYADKIISAHLDTTLCFNFEKNVFSDLLARQTVVFLQHGIIKDDLSSVYSRFSRKIDLFVTSARAEYESIVGTPNYACDASVVKMTGLPRYDKLENKREKLISVVPTWRKYCTYLAGGESKITADFTECAYFRFYHTLLSDPALRAAAEKYGYRIQLVQHHLMAEATPLFEDIPGLTVVRDPDYTEVFSKSALMLTDYSSTAFDMAYLHKPIVYCQFDREEFFASHTYTEGYFSYERDGFGEVVCDLDAARRTLISYMENDCALKPEYEERINRFFPYHDRNNCARVLDAIREVSARTPTDIFSYHRGKKP